MKRVEFRKTRFGRQMLIGMLMALIVTVVPPAYGVTWQWDGGAGTSNWQTGNNWNPDGSIGTFNGTFADRLNVNGAQDLVYSAAEGTTVYGTSGIRGVVIGSGTLGSGTMRITGGTFSTANANQTDVVGNTSGNTGTLIIDGGDFIGNSAGLDLGIGGGPTAILTINSGSATVAALTMNNTSGTIYLNGGTLTLKSLTDSGGTNTINFNGGTYKADAVTAGFSTLNYAYVQSGGAIFDTNGYNIVVAQPLLDGGGGGGLTKSGAGELTLSGTNTYTGQTTVSAGQLTVANASALGSTSGNTTVSNGARLVLNNGITVSGESITIAGNGGDNYAGALQAASGSAQWNGAVVLGANARIGAQAGGTLTVSGAIQNGTGTSLEISGLGGTGTVVFSGTNKTYTGNTSIIRGILKIANDNALPTSTVLDVDSSTAAENSTFDLNNFSQTVAGLQRSGTASGGGSEVTNSGGSLRTLTVNQSGNTNYSGNITGNLALTKAGGGALTLSGANSYAGSTTLSGGTLILENAAALPGNLNYTTSARTTVGSGANGGQGGVVAFTSSAGSQYFDLNGNTFTIGGLTGSSTVNNLSAVQNNNSGANGTVIIDNATDYLYASYIRNQAGTLALTKEGNGKQTLVGQYVSYTGATTVNNGTLALQDTTAFASTSTVNVTGTLALNRTVNGFASRNKVSALITGSGILNVSNSTAGIGGGWVTFNSASSGLSNFTGTVNVNSGVLAMDNIAGAWSGNPDLNVVSGGIFAIRAQNISVDALSGDGDVANTWNGHGAAGDTLTVGANNGSGSFSGVIHGSVATGGTDGTIEQGILNLVKTGTGTQTLAGSSPNTYTGMTTLNAGKLILAKSAGVNAIGGDLTITPSSGWQVGGVAANGVELAASEQIPDTSVIHFTGSDWSGFRTEGYTETVAGLDSPSGKGVIENVGKNQSGTSVDGTMILAGSGTYAFNGYIRNNDATGSTKLNLTKTGTGTQTLIGAQISYSGQTTVDAGTLVFQNNNNLNTSMDIDTDGTLVLQQDSGQLNLGTLTISGDGTLTVRATTPVGVVCGQNGNTAVSMTGGQINVETGMLRNNNRRGNWTANKASMYVAGGAFLDTYADDIYVDALTGSGTVQNGYNDLDDRIFIGVNGGSGTFDGAIAKVTGKGDLSVIKQGAGTQVLTGANTYSGTTTVSEGTLLVNGTHTGGAAYTVNGTGTLGGYGTIGSPVTIAADGTLAPGNTPGILTLTNGLTFTGGTFEVEIKGTTPGTEYDQVMVTGGNVELGSGVADLSLIVDSGYNPGIADYLWIIDNTGGGTTAGNFASLPDSTSLFINGRRFYIYYNADHDTAALLGGNDVLLTSVPEPSTLAMLLGLAGVGLLGWLRRRRS